MQWRRKTVLPGVAKGLLNTKGKKYWTFSLFGDTLGPNYFLIQGKGVWVRVNSELMIQISNFFCSGFQTFQVHPQSITLLSKCHRNGLETQRRSSICKINYINSVPPLTLCTLTLHVRHMLTLTLHLQKLYIMNNENVLHVILTTNCLSNQLTFHLIIK